MMWKNRSPMPYAHFTTVEYPQLWENLPFPNWVNGIIGIIYIRHPDKEAFLSFLDSVKDKNADYGYFRWCLIYNQFPELDFAFITKQTYSDDEQKQFDRLVEQHGEALRACRLILPAMVAKSSLTALQLDDMLRTSFSN